MKIIYLIIFLSFTFFDIKAQTVVLEREVEGFDSIASLDRTFGPNRKHYVHQFIGVGSILQFGDEGAEIRQPASLDFTFGIRYKFRWSNFLSSGLELNYNSLDFHLKQQQGKTLPDTILHRKEKITFYNLEGNIYQRFNYGQRGDVIGNFIDIGAGYIFSFSTVHHYQDDVPTGERRKVKTYKLQFINKTCPVAFIRFGWNRFSIYGKYRLGDLIKEPLPDLPKLSAGLQIGLH